MVFPADGTTSPLTGKAQVKKWKRRLCPAEATVLRKWDLLRGDRSPKAESPQK